MQLWPSEAALLEPVLNELRGYLIGAPKRARCRGPEAVKSGWYPDLTVIFSEYVCLLFFEQKRHRQKTTKRWKSPQQLRAAYSIFYFAKILS
jgi:hypothetical protein